MVDQYGSEQYQQLLRLATELDLDGQQIQQLRNITQYGALDREGELSVQDSAAGDFAGMEAVLDGSQLAISGGRAHTSALGELQLAGYQYGSTIPDSGVFRFTFDEEDTDASADETTDIWNDIVASINGSVATGVSGQLEEAFDFSGGHISLSHSSVVTGDGLSVSAWINQDSRSDFGGIVGDSRDDGFNYYLLQYHEQDSEYRFWIGDGSSKDSAGFAESNVGLDSWHHIVGTYDGSEIAIYLDGSQLNTTSSSKSVTTDSGYVGKYVGNGKAFTFDGVIDDPRMYQKGLSSEEVSNLYNTGSIDG